MRRGRGGGGDIKRNVLGGCTLALAGTLLGCGSAATPARVWSPGDSRVFSPYVDVTLTAPFDLASVAPDAGARSLTLAFVTAAEGKCRPAWGAGEAIAAPMITAAASRLRAAGVALRVSFGGARGEELAQRCRDARGSALSDLQNAYASVLDRYHATAADFDLEGPALADAQAVARRARATVRLQARRRLAVSLTLPASPTGLSAPALAAVRAMLAAGVRLSTVNLLAMNYDPSEVHGHMAIATVRALRAAHRQLAVLSSELSRWSSLGVVVMVGVNDLSGEVLTLADARALSNFADHRGLGSTSIWSLARDRPCAGSPSGAQATCSGVGEAPYAFSRAFGAHAKPGALARRAVY